MVCVDILSRRGIHYGAHGTATGRRLHEWQEFSASISGV